MQNNSQSLNANLAEGGTDGKYKKVVADRGGSVDPATYEARRDLSDAFFGIHEARNKVLGDASIHVTPDFVTTPLADPAYFG